MRLVRESLGFERKKDPRSAMGIGSRARIEKWLDQMYVNEWIINDDLSIDIEGGVYLSDIGPTLPPFIQFGKVKDSFRITNSGLISLRGCPHTVGLVFNCENNRLDSLVGAPYYVQGNFLCSNNSIKFSINDVKEVCRVGGEIYV